MYSLGTPLSDDETDDDTPYQRRLNGQWLYTTALRETFGIALRGTTPTYEQIFSIADRLAPEILGRQQLLFRENESKEARKYRQKAQLRSEQNQNLQETTALSVVESEIKDLEKLLQGDKEHKQNIVAEDLEELHKVRKELLDQEKTAREEQELILKDWKLGIDLPNFIGDDGYHDFALPGHRVMRIRLLHPLEAERITGADLLYEHHEPANKRARIAAVQYKIWTGKGLSINADIEDQLDRLSKVFCKNDMCKELNGGTCRYRFPYCTAFLRPTDKLQSYQPRLASSGYHIQICDIPQLTEFTPRGNKRLTVKKMKEQAISYLIFEELFNIGKLGSRWLTYDELEQFHHSYSILKPQQQAAIHVQEVQLAR